MKNVLVTSSASKVLLIKVLKEACEKYGVELITSDLTRDKPSSYFSHTHVVLPVMSHAEYLPALLSVCKEKNIGFIIPTRDDDLLWFAENESTLLQQGIRVCQSSAEAIHVCSDKMKFHTFCVQHKLPIPENYNHLTDIEFPCVLKLRKSSASRGVKIIRNKEQLDAEVLLAGEFNKDYFVQQHIADKEYTIDAFFDVEGEMVIAIPRERIQVVNGESSVSRTADVPQLVKLVEDLSDNLKFFGHITVQAFCSESGVVNLVEVNPRFGGASNLGIVAGVCSPRRLLASLADDTDNVYRTDYIKYNLKMLRYSTDLILQE